MCIYSDGFVGLVGFAGPGTPATGPVYRDVVGSGTAGRTLSTYNAFPVCVPSHTKDIWLAMNQRAPGYVIFASPRGLPFDPPLIRQMAPHSIYSPDTAGLAFVRI